MKTKLIAAIAAMFLTFMPSAFADDSGFYVTVRGGPAFMGSASNDVNLPVGGLTFDVKSENNLGIGIAGTGGYKFKWGLRVEGEVAWRRNGINRLRVVGLGIPASGSVSSLAFMGNAYWDFDNKTRWTPYVGGGLGIANVSINSAKAKLPGGSVTVADDSDTVFAYQAGAGVMFQVMRGVDAILDYRYFATASPSFRHKFGGGFRSQYHTHNVTLGVKVAF